MFTPVDLTKCPFILLLSGGTHDHPIPSPTRTPVPIRAQVITLLLGMGTDLVNATPRRAARHAAVQYGLKLLLPRHPGSLNSLLPGPTLTDLHPSFNNKSHVKFLIQAVRRQVFPHGTDFEGMNSYTMQITTPPLIRIRLQSIGVMYAKKMQDACLPLSEWYIREVVTRPCSVDSDEYKQWKRDVVRDPTLPEPAPYRYIVCMYVAQSYALQRDAKYINADIMFKRISGSTYVEFELAGWSERHATSMLPSSTINGTYG